MLKRQLLPMAVRVFSLPGLNRVPSVLESIGATLQSKKGGGTDALWQEVTGAVQFIRRPDPLVLDVGANAGQWTTGFMKMVPGVKRVVMFEPQPSCWNRLEPMQSPTVVLEKKALSSSVGEMSFWQCRNSEISSFYTRTDFPDKAEVIQVQATTLDSYLDENDIRQVDFLKMDIEGHELSAIRGAVESLKTKRISTFSFEFGVANVNSRTFFIDLWEFATGLGMKIYRIDHDGVPTLVERYSRDLEFFGGVANYIASFLPPSRQRH